MEFFGITRFSVVTTKTLGSFRATRGQTLEDAKQIIFNPARLDIRSLLFKNFCFPTYKMLSESHKNSHGIILINRDLPEPYKSDLVLLCSTVARLFVVEMDEEAGVAPTARRLIRKLAGGGRIFSYRYDEDDALPVDYITKISSISDNIANNNLISFNYGYSLSRVDSSKFVMVKKNYPMNAFGLGIVSSKEDFKLIFGLGNHTKIDLPTYHETSSIGWLSTVHGANDSRVGKLKDSYRSDRSIAVDLKDRFPHITDEAIASLPVRNATDRSAPD